MITRRLKVAKLKANLPKGKRVGAGETIESLKFAVPGPSSDGDYIRIGPGDPLSLEELAKFTAEAALAGDTSAALDILRDFVGAVDQHNERTWRGPVHFAYAQYLAHAFSKIVRARMKESGWKGAKWGDVETGDAEADANLALGIKSSKAGRRKGAATHNDEALAAAFNLLVVSGLRPEKAKEELQRRIGADKRTIEKANASHVTYQIYCRRAQRLDIATECRDSAIELIKVGAKPYVSHVTAILQELRTEPESKKR